jgi:hypothetical protein
MTRAAVGFRKSPPSEDLLRSVGRAERAAPTDDSPLAAALRAIVTYIPTEIVTTYVAVLAALADDESASRAGQWVALLTFSLLAPLTVWVLFATKLRAEGLPLPRRFAQWPRWEMSAALLAFLSWSYALPDAPFQDWSWYQASLGTVLLLVMSFGLGLLAPLFQPASTDAA